MDTGQLNWKASAELSGNPETPENTVESLERKTKPAVQWVPQQKMSLAFVPKARP